MKFYFQLFFISMFILSCSHQASKSQTPKERLISRMDNLTQRPAWVQELKPLSIQKNKIIALGTSALNDEHRVDISYRIAERNGKHFFQSSLEKELSSIFKNLVKPSAVELKHFADFQMDFLRSVMDEVRPVLTYWEKVEVTKAQEASTNQNKFFVSLEMSKDLFIKKLDQNLAKFQKKKYLSKSAAKQIKSHWLNYLTSLKI